MRKIYLLMLALASSVSIMAQHSAMTFVGVSKFAVLTASVDNEKDTVSFAMSSSTTGDITIPAASYTMGTTQMNLPSFTIHDAQFTMDMTTMTATFADQTFSETLTVNGVEKKVTGKSLTGTYSHSDNTLDLVVKFQYGAMPLVATYTIKGYYVKSCTGDLAVVVGSGSSAMNMEAKDVTYYVRKYMDGETQKVDVAIPSYKLEGTQMGDLTVGSYTVCGLEMSEDDTHKGFYRDYANDGLQMYFNDSMNGITAFEGNYALATAGGEYIWVTYNDNGSITIENAFKPGSMPLPIVTTLSTASSSNSGTTGIELAEANDEVSASDSVESAAAKANGVAYNVYGQRVAPNTKGIVIIGGKKFFNK